MFENCSDDFLLTFLLVLRDVTGPYASMVARAGSRYEELRLAENYLGIAAFLHATLQQDGAALLPGPSPGRLACEVGRGGGLLCV